jgi:diphthine-ammonia ligase
MATSLNVVALISGGKDSLFSILHCQANGHNVVALANLHPADAADGNEDIDSYMSGTPSYRYTNKRWAYLFFAKKLRAKQ